MLQAEKRFVMTKITKITACLICICAVFGTASCGKKASLPDVRDLGQILTVSREEGSGTRTEFDMNLKVTEQNADQVVSSTRICWRRLLLPKMQSVMWHTVPLRMN